MNNNSQSHPWRRAIVALLSLQMALGPLASPAYAAVTLLADEPIGFSPSAPPNIMLTIDDSTSMLSDFLPDYVIGEVPGAAPLVGGFCRDTNGTMQAPCGFIGSPTTPPYIRSTANFPFGNAANVSAARGNPPNSFNYAASSIPNRTLAWPAPVHSNALNRVYYDPAVTYSPPLHYDGTSYPNQTLFTAVVADPWAVPAGRRNVNLTNNVSVGMWCNSDWPNNTDWNPATGGGAECRINGTDYSSTAPFAPADYQYPWQKQSGADDPKYFWRASGNNTSGSWAKTLYCKTGHAKYPKNCTTAMVCPVATVPNTPVAQSCFLQSTATACAAGATVYSPAGCNTNPLYGSPGPCVGAECLVCTSSCSLTVETGKNGRCRLASSSGSGSGGSNSTCNCSGPGCALPACPNYTPPPSCPVPLVEGATSCSNITGGCAQPLHDPMTKLNTGITMLEDAEGAGEVCRRNNKAYPDGTIALPFNYPGNGYTTARTNSCPTVPFMATIPRHYWKTSVEWCSSKITADNDKWRGFGVALTCQDEHDLAHPYPRFYKYGVAKTDDAYLDNYTHGAFERVDLVATTPTYTHTFVKAGVPTTITRTYLEEMTNYSNWFSYYRTRIQAAKTVISQNFTFLDDTYRVGFHTLSNDPTSTFVDIDAFDAASGGQKDLWYEQLFGVQIKMGNDTPNIDAIVRIGELFKNGGEASLLGSSDPIVLTCQKNYHMLFTDGITKQVALPAVTVGNVDSTVPALPQPIVVSPAIVAGSPWPPLYREDSGASLSNTLADYTTHYWVTDLRPLMTDNVLIGKDPAPWQHLNFAALSLGTEGTLPGHAPGTVESQIAAGTLLWPTPTPSSWAPDATGVDDLWHAAVNARGRFVNAKTSQQLGRGIAAILSDITSPAGSNAGATFANPNLSVTNNFTYIAKFVQGWGGSVQKVQINPATGTPEMVLWDAETALIGQTTPSALVPTPWYTNRKIVTINDAGTKVAFVRGSLGATQLATLGPDATTQDKVIEYLRGRRDNEGEDDGQFRVRASPLGDIVNSQPQLVGPMSTDYWDHQEANDPGYAAFRATHASRPARIYVGANDGMLHAFDDVTGAEAWAFIPSDLYRDAPPVSNDKAGLIGLTYQPGGLPIYAHRFYVDATPRIADVDFGGPDWRTILVGGLGKGGKSYYALDVTDPNSITDEASAAGKILWEFKNADLGYTYGRPSIIKTRAFGWTVVVSAGYNNASGEGKLFFLRPSDGTLLKTMTTSFGSPGDPSGMTHFAGFTKDYRNQVAEQIYAGDLKGNVWRFDVSDPVDSNWVVEKFATLTDGGGTPQPITTPPRIDIDISNGIDRWVFVGTGRLLHVDDLDDSQAQRMYAMRDGTYTTPGTITTPLTVSDLDSVSGVMGLGAGVVATKGWYDDLPAGQRIVRTPVTAVGLVAYISTGLPLDPCTVGQPANIFVRQFGNGQSRLQDGGGNYIETIYEPTGAAGVEVISTYDAGCTANCIPKIKLAVLSSQNSQIMMFDAKLPDIIGQHRLSWRSLQQ